MLFNSYEFIFAFLPAAFFGYFGLSRLRLTGAARIWLLIVSLFFYAWWEPAHLPLILISIGVNYGFGRWLSGSSSERSKKHILIVGIAFNLAVLGFFKYGNFVAGTINSILGTQFEFPYLSLPLGISFFTFTQIAFLVDARQNPIRPLRPVEYGLFVTFFPHLLAGPIVHHGQLMPQFSHLRNHVVRYRRVFLGLFYFLAGLFQKSVLADHLAPIADAGFRNASALTFVEAWAALLAYALQIYFDFAGYSNMAIGLAHFFNIRFPVNFDSPYQARSVIDFWRRWHITLSNFLRDYLYIPLGGSRSGHARRYLNLLVTMLIGGLWHGAGWTFVVWGGYHGGLLMLNHAVRRMKWAVPEWLGRAVTFILICYGWVFFRSANWAQSEAMTQALIGARGVRFHDLPFIWTHQMAVIAALAAVAWFLPNIEYWAKKIRPTVPWFLMFAFVWTVAALMLNRASPFLYFQF